MTNPYGDYGANNFLQALIYGNRMWGGQKEQDQEKIKMLEHALSVPEKAAEGGAWEGYQGTGKYEDVNLADGRTALRETTELSPMGKQALSLGGQARVDSLQSTSDAKLKEIETKKMFEMFDRTTKAFDYYKSVAENDKFSPDAKQALFDTFIQASDKIGIKTGITPYDTIKEKDEKWKAGITNKVGEIFTAWKNDPSTQNESAFLAALSRGKGVIDVDTWKTAYTAQKESAKKVENKERWSEPYTGPGGSLLRKNLDTGKVESVLGRKGENGEGQPTHQKKLYSEYIASQKKAGETPQPFHSWLINVYPSIPWYLRSPDGSGGGASASPPSQPTKTPQRPIPKNAETGTYNGVRAYKLNGKFYDMATGKEMK
jgi:hypothetical protein